MYLVLMGRERQTCRLVMLTGTPFVEPTNQPTINTLPHNWDTLCVGTPPHNMLRSCAAVAGHCVAQVTICSWQAKPAPAAQQPAPAAVVLAVVTVATHLTLTPPKPLPRSPPASAAVKRAAGARWLSGCRRSLSRSSRQARALLRSSSDSSGVETIWSKLGR